MVLEALINPLKAEKTPAVMILLGFVYTTLAVFLGMWLFNDHASMVFVFFTTMACIPLIYSTLKFEEEKDLQDFSEKMLLKEHGKALTFFMYLFVGMAIACTLWYVALPAETVSNLFQSQIDTFNKINGRVTAAAAGERLATFNGIFLNNMKVMVFCVLFSFIYGAGAIFILAWNASVIGFAMGNFIRGNLASYAHLIGFERTSQYLQVITIGLFKYVIHGVPEILAYFTAALAGGIISIAVIRHDFGTKKFEHILLDSADLFLISIGLLLVAAALEVWVTPIIF